MLKGRKRLFLYAFGFLLLLALVAGWGAYSFLRSGLPRYSGYRVVEDLQEDVAIHRDYRGVPYIYAWNDDDLYLAQGYAHAQERLWQMDLQRRVVQGRLSEAFGPDQVDTDIFLRKIDLAGIARAMLEQTGEDSLRNLESYARGVNAYIESNPLSLEFRLLGLEPEPWTPLDSVGTISLMAFDLGDNWRTEIFRQAMLEEIGPERLVEIAPPFPGWETPRVWTPDRAGANSTDLLELMAKGSLDHILALPRSGSNSWVIGPRLSETGTAMLANDPHLSLSFPSVWYENALILEGEEDKYRYGWSIPGLPGIVIGQNGKIAWGMTNIGDTQDLFLEIKHSREPCRFLYNGEWYEAEVEDIAIKVKGKEEPVSAEIVRTRNGPLISQAPLLSLRWTAYDLEASTIDALFRVNRAANWDEFTDALAYFSIPMQAFVYADTSGNIGMRVGGMAPLRSEGYGLLPQPGWDSRYGWEGYVPHKEMPALLNPAEGYIATANHRLEHDDYPYIIAHDAAPPYRKKRIGEYIRQNQPFTLAGSRNLQTDWYNRHAAERLPRFLELLTEEEEQFSELELKALAQLRRWAANPVNKPESAAAAIFQVWYLELMAEVFEEKLGQELYEQFLGLDYQAYNALEYLLEKEQSGWLPSGPRDSLVRSFRRSVEDLSRRLGEEPEQWRWDDLQSISLQHDLGAVPVLGDYLFNRGPYPYGGDHMTVGRARYSLQEPFAVVGAAGLRFLAVMDQPVLVQAVIAGGQSGHPLSAHYCDQLSTWLDGGYYEVIMPQDLSSGRYKTYRLEPAGP